MTALPEVDYPPVLICPRCEAYAETAEPLPRPYATKLRPLKLTPCGHTAAAHEVQVVAGLGVTFSRSTEVEVHHASHR